MESLTLIATGDVLTWEASGLALFNALLLLAVALTGWALVRGFTLPEPSRAEPATPEPAASPVRGTMADALR